MPVIIDLTPDTTYRSLPPPPHPLPVSLFIYLLTSAIKIRAIYHQFRIGFGSSPPPPPSPLPPPLLLPPPAFPPLHYPLMRDITLDSAGFFPDR